MEKRLVRVVMKGRAKGTDEDDVSIVVDLIIDGSHHACPPMGSSVISPVSGWLGSPKKGLSSSDTWFYPFVIVPSKNDLLDAYIDFGQSLSEDRDGRTNLLSKELRKGELATVWMSDDGEVREYLMRIVDLTELIVMSAAL